MTAELEDPNLDDTDLDDGSPEVEPKVSKPESHDELKAAMAELAGTVKTLATPKEAPEPELTQEQKNELWAVYNPEATRKDFMKKFFRLNPDATPEEETEARDLFKEMQQGLMKQAVTGSRNLMQIELSKRDEKLARLEEYVSKQNAEQTKTRFYTQFASLSDPRYAKVIAATAKELASGTFADEASYFKALAEGAAETIKGIIPEFDLGASQTKTKSAGTSPRLPRTSVGGTGGTGGGKQAALSVKGDATDEFLDED